MLVGASSFQHNPFAETEFLSKTQVCTGILYSPSHFKVCRRKFIGLGTDPYCPASRAEFLTQKRQDKPSSQKSKADRSVYQRKDLHSLKETRRQHSQESYNVTHSQDLQGLKGIFNEQAAAPAKLAVDLEQQRVARADTNSRVRAIPAHNQPDTQSKWPSSADSLGSPDAEKKPGNALAVTRGKNAHPTRRRGSRNSARSFDVLDELMSSQGRSSRAVLESLQSAVAIENEDMPYVHPHERDTSKGYSDSRAANPSRSEFAEGKRGGIMSQMLFDFRRIDTRQPTHEATTDTAPTSTTFASSIGKALSPSKALEIHSGTVSEVAKPSLRGQEVMWALQKAAVEKAKLKQKARKVSDKASKVKEAASLYDSGEWRNAKPIVVKAEWALQIDELERRIESLKNVMPSS